MAYSFSDGEIFTEGKGEPIYQSEDDFILMQYTGLKDKNGREIYEGDILWFPEEEMTILIRWDHSGAGWQFDEINAFDDGVGRGDWDFKIGISKSSEVIGDIYQNSELLE